MELDGWTRAEQQSPAMVCDVNLALPALYTGRRQAFAALPPVMLTHLDERATAASGSALAETQRAIAQVQSSHEAAVGRLTRLAEATQAGFGVCVQRLDQTANATVAEVKRLDDTDARLADFARQLQTKVSSIDTVVDANAKAVAGYLQHVQLAVTNLGHATDSLSKTWESLRGGDPSRQG